MRSPEIPGWLAGVIHPSLRELFPIPTHLTNREKLALFRLARTAGRERQDATIVEIGAYLGASSAFLAAGVSKGNGHLFCIDTWNNDAMSEGGRDTMSEFLANTARFAGSITPVRGISTDPDVINVIATLPGGIDLLFIDGDHGHDAVLSDWLAYAPLLSSGAVVAMHDFGWAEGVQRVVAEQIRPRVAAEHRLPNLWWGRMSP